MSFQESPLAAVTAWQEYSHSFLYFPGRRNHFKGNVPAANEFRFFGNHCWLQYRPNQRKLKEILWR